MAPERSLMIVKAVWLSMQTMATFIQVRWELMLRNPTKPSTARPKRLENQKRGAEKAETSDRSLISWSPEIGFSVTLEVRGSLLSCILELIESTFPSVVVVSNDLRLRPHEINLLPPIDRNDRNLVNRVLF